MISKTMAFILAILAYIMLSYGFILQKKGIAFIGYKGGKDQQYKKNKLLWFSGLLLINLVNIPLFFSLKVLPSHIVNAISGLNVLFTVIFAWLILHEKIMVSDFVYAIILCLAIALANISDSQKSVMFINIPVLYFFAFFPLFIFGLVLFSDKIKALHGFSLIKGIIAVVCGGSMGGFMIIAMKTLQLKGGNSFLPYVTSPLLYIYLIHGIISIAAIQYAYKKGDMIVIAPGQYASLVFYPVFASYFIFGLEFIFLQLIAFAVILFSIIMIVKSHASTLK